jgi:DNA repair protein RecN (Recombination protein N)
LNTYGKDEVAFLFSANKNAEPQPVAKIASGGETARVMLCIKSLLSATSGLPTIVFDEIDTGVSGEIADRMGDIMQEISAGMQVIVITHLPQIAAKGRAHYKVYKTDSEHSTSTHIRQLNDDERVSELAQMLSGAGITEAALENARQLLNANRLAYKSRKMKYPYL